MIKSSNIIMFVVLIVTYKHLYAAPGDVDILVKNGAAAKLEDYPEVVAIEVRRRDGARSFCSGVLIASDAVLSAGHCVQDGYQPVRVTAALSINQAIPSDNNYARQPATGTAIVQSIKVLSFSAMDPSSIAQGKKLAGRDLLIIKLSAKFQHPAIPVAIANLNGIDSAKKIRFVGFGMDGRGSQGRKLYADVDIISARCRSGAQGDEADCSADAEMYAKTSDNKFDACPGDSGGPAYIRNSGGDYRLVGITSRAPSYSQQCGGGTFVTLLDGKRLEWIKTQVEVKLTSEPLHPMLPSITACVPPKCYTE